MCPRGPCEKILYQARVPRTCSPQSFPSFLPGGLTLSAQQLELQVKQHLLSNATCSKGWWRNTGVAAFKCYLLCLLPRSFEAIPSAPAPVHLQLHCCSAPLQEHTAPRHCLQHHLSSCQQRLLTPASWDTPQMKGNRAVNQTENVLAASGFWVFSQRVRRNREK